MFKKALLFFFFFVLCVLASGPTGVSASFEENGEVILSPTTGTWDNRGVAMPEVIKENDVYKMWYEGYDGVKWSFGYATSSDGKNWVKRDSPILIPQSENGIDEKDIFEPSVVKTDQYYMFYNSRDSSFMHRIRLATSIDGISWTKYPDPVLIPTEDWETSGVTHPTVIFHDGKFKMWYAALGSGTWRAGYAESPDGISWSKSPENPLDLPTLGHLGGLDIIFYENNWHLFYHTGEGVQTNIYHVVSDDLTNWHCEENCSAFRVSEMGFDSVMVIGPSVVKVGNKLLLYYTGDDGNLWRVGLTNEVLLKQKPKIVIIPGLMASWNKEALIHQTPVTPTDWIMNPIVKDYNGLIATLKNLGLEKNKDYFLFNYDWRKGIDSIVADLKLFLDEQDISTKPYSLVGHSLGGLVGRIYAQKYGTANLDRIITLGTPHLGVPQVYKAIAGGELDESSELLWLAQKLALVLYRTGLETEREIINNHLPVLRDLLPIYPYIYDGETAQNYSEYFWQNDFLKSYSDLTTLDPFLSSLVGTKGSTTYAYKLGKRTVLDKLLGNYPEGRPIGTVFETGDYVVSSLSAITTHNQKLELGHGELVSDTQGIEEVLKSMGLEYDQSQLVTGEETKIFPSLIFLVMSPVTLEVISGDKTYSENEDVVLIESPSDGEYIVRAIGKSQGDYTILIGNLNRNQDSWLKLRGTIGAEEPLGAVDEYHLRLKKTKLVLSEAELLSQLITNLQSLNLKINQRLISLAIQKLQLVKHKIISQPCYNCHSLMSKANRDLLLAFRKVPSKTKPEFYTNLEMLNSLYNQNQYVYGRRAFGLFKAKYLAIKILMRKKEQQLLNRQKRGRLDWDDVFIWQKIQALMKQGELALQNNDIAALDISTQTIAQLMLDI